MIKFLFFILTFLSLPVLGEDVIRYEVKKNDSLSKILLKLNIGPIYGEKGYQQLSSKVNNLPRSGDALKVGEVLVFPRSLVNRRAASDDVLPTIPEPASEQKKLTETEGYTPPSHHDFTVPVDPVAPAAPVEEPVEEPKIFEQKKLIEVQGYVPPSHHDSAITEVEDSSADQYHSLIFSPQVSWANFTSKSSDQYQDNKLKVFTKTIPGAHLQYRANWDRNWSATVFSFISRIGFYHDDQVRYKDSSVQRNNYGVGLEYKNEGSEWGARFGFFDKLFYTLPSSTQVDPQVVAMPEVLLSYKTNLKEYKKMVTKLALTGAVILPHDSPRIKGELGYGGEAALLVGTQKKYLKLFYTYEQVNAQNNKTLVSEFGLGFVIEGHFYE
ncbi:MAG TPA: LysM peptidoglycan-binding domain-containing protein [Bacteriovoracaceae bacterium]|nr:LysM peptidoglycan-binding domain-containing protein [Bacteriovoracaceae bacterium]